jgi:biopolymer transport protein TolQ
MEPALATASAAPAHDLSMVALFLAADPIVKGVMILLVLASVACWTVVIDKTFRLSRFSRAVKLLEDAASRGDVAKAGPLPEETSAILEAGLREWRDDAGNESRAERRERIERAMRSTLAEKLRALEAGLPLLATIGSAGPFIGLFGTVWGIMNSFTAIASSNDTSLAVVAPGIAEALFATAIGLVAAIPAVIAYNRLSVRLGRLGQRSGAAVGMLGNDLARRRPGPQMREAV